MVMESRVVRVCDACRGPVEADPVRLWWDGAFYDADLCDAHADELSSVMSAITSSARRLGAPGGPSAPAKPDRPEPVGRRSRIRADTAAVRLWAKSEGIEVSEKGRVPDALIARYDAVQRTRPSGTRTRT